MDCSGQSFLQIIDSFEIQGKTYGDTIMQPGRILQTFTDRSASTGVLLVGEKGNRETLLAKYISVEAARDDISTIVINSNLYGEKFYVLLQSIERPVIVSLMSSKKYMHRTMSKSRCSPCWMVSNTHPRNSSCIPQMTSGASTAICKIALVASIT